MQYASSAFIAPSPHLSARNAAALPTTVATRDGLSLTWHHWPLPAGTAAKGVVCLVHGLGEHGQRYEHVARELNQWGWHVVGYDHRGHGRSPGPRGGLSQDDDLLHDLASVIDATRAHYPGLPLTLIAHSLGGLIGSRFVSALAQPREQAAWSRPVDRLVLSSPALDLGMSAVQRALLATFGTWLPNQPVSNGLKPEWVCNDPGVMRAYVQDPLVHDRITGKLTRFMVDSVRQVQARAATWTTPTLLIYAGADRCVDPAGARAFARAAPAAVVTTTAYPHMAHEILNEPDRASVMADLRRWMDTGDH